MTAIYYSPHPDDEAIGMAGSIARAKLAGRRVVMVLLTDSLPSERAQRLFSGQLRCPVHHERHDLPVDLAAARALEFRAVCRELEADEVGVMGIPETIAYEELVARIRAVVGMYSAAYPLAEHHFVAGARDVASNGVTHPTHRACCEVGQYHAPAGCTIVFHRAYVYGHPMEKRTADLVRILEHPVMLKKRAALEAYKAWRPDQGLVAFGYHSVPELFDAAAQDPHEYEDHQEALPECPA